MMRRIVLKLIHQAKYDGFIRFKDGNPINFSRYNLEKVDFNYAVRSINTNIVTDWNASLDAKETTFVKQNKDDFIRKCNEIKSEHFF